MGRLSLILADNDSSYAAGLEKFLVINHPRKFDIFSFSSYEKLADFLDNNDRKDILLINSGMYSEELRKKNIGSLIFLSGDNTDSVPEGLGSVFKYQHIDKLVTDMIRLYTADCHRECPAPVKSRTKLICVCSSAGGAGVSSISAGLSILCAGRGLRTFYLNLENIPSTGVYLQSVNRECNFSNVIYHLKEKGTNLGLKLEGLKSCDLRSGVSFFPPPDSILELEELTARDISALLNEFKTGASYDAVFIDMAACLDKRASAVFSAADMILLVVVPGENTSEKLRRLKEGFDILGRKHGICLDGRLYEILNRSGGVYPSGFAAADEIYSAGADTCGFSVTAEIGDYSGQTGKGYPGCLLENVSFLSDLNGVLDIILSTEAVFAGAAGGASGGFGVGRAGAVKRAGEEKEAGRDGRILATGAAGEGGGNGWERS